MRRIIKYKGVEYKINYIYDIFDFDRVIRDEVDMFSDENLTKTYPLSDVKEYLIDSGYLENIDFFIHYTDRSLYRDNDCFTIKYILDHETSIKYNKIINDLQIKLGWIHSTTTIILSDEAKPFIYNDIILDDKTDFNDETYYGRVYRLSFEPKFDIISFKGNIKARKFYCFISICHLSDVMNYGLRFEEYSSKTIYITDNIDCENFDSLVIDSHKSIMRYSEHPTSYKDVNKYIILEIDLTNYDKIDSLKDIEIYKEMYYYECYYIKHNIAPNFIKPIFEYIVSGNKLFKKILK